MHTFTKSEQFVLGPVYLDWPNLFEAVPYKGGNRPPAPDARKNFHVNVIMNPEQTQLVNQKCIEVANQGFTGVESQDRDFLWPFMMVEKKKNAIYGQMFPGHYMMNCKAGEEYPPVIKGPDKQDLKPEMRSLIYSGVKAHVVINLMSYQEGRNTGIRCGLAKVITWGLGDRIPVGLSLIHI